VDQQRALRSVFSSSRSQPEMVSEAVETETRHLLQHLINVHFELPAISSGSERVKKDGG
jgi:hypothetical protein